MAIERLKVRGFEVAKPFDLPDLELNVRLPERATAESAGYDFFAMKGYALPEGSTTLIATGVKAYMKAGEVLILANRSSNPKRGLILANGIGVIDRDYYSNPDNDGHIMFMFTATRTVQIKAGDKLGQGYFTHYLAADADNTTTKRMGGFGSTDA